MRTVFSYCRLRGALTSSKFIAAMALSLFFVVGIMPVSSYAQALSQANAQEQGGGAPPLDARDVPAQTLFSQAASMEREDTKNAVAKYEEVMQRYGRASTPGSRLFAARALLNKGGVLGRQGDAKEAVATYERIERNFGNEKTPAIREVLASAFVSKAEALYKMGSAEKAVDTYKQLEKQFDKDENDFIRRLVDITKWRVAEISSDSNNKMTLSSGK
ncbi:MAG: hypothetical protein FWG26_10340 [Betaproteobacteria bacterium]|nr:hypothetical protein [Betaproteobacteria bacterium]